MPRRRQRDRKLKRQHRRKREREWERRQERTRRRIRALAARMPEELFERVLGYMEVKERRKGARAYIKKELGRCALVSTYWAPRCQEKIFREIELRSAEDVRDLLAMLDRPGTTIAQYIHEFTILHEDSPPWVHLVPLLYRKLPPSSRHKRYLWRSFPEKRTLRTIHPDLPRTVPAHNTRLHKLELVGTRFACFGDLVHLLDELRDLRTLHCWKVTWAKGPPLTHLRSTRPRCTCLDTVDLENFPLDEYTLWLLSVYRAPPNTLRLNVTDDRFYSTLRAFFVTAIPGKPDLHEYYWEAVRYSHQTSMSIPPSSL